MKQEVWVTVASIFKDRDGDCFTKSSLTQISKDLRKRIAKSHISVMTPASAGDHPRLRELVQDIKFMNARVSVDGFLKVKVSVDPAFGPYRSLFLVPAGKILRRHNESILEADFVSFMLTLTPSDSRLKPILGDIDAEVKSSHSNSGSRQVG